jgi:hypothetical protein
MAYRERGSGPPHFDGKNYHMWQRWMAAFLRDKGQILWDVTVNTTYVYPMNFLAPGSRDMLDANNRRSTTCTILCVNRNSSGSDRGLGMRDLEAVEECSCRERSVSGSALCDLPERV